MPEFPSLPVWQNFAVVAVAAVVVWFAGTRLSDYAEEISHRTRLTQAMAGLLLLAFVTSLPEVATTLTASIGGNAHLATSNILGGVAMQTAILALADGIGFRGALTYFSPNPILLMQAVLLILLLATAIAFSVAGQGVSVAAVGLGPVVVLAIYALGIFVTERFERHAAWEAVNPPKKPVQSADGREYRQISNRRLYSSFTVASAAVLVAGWAVTKASDKIAGQTGLGASFIGATLLALTTSLPELSTTIRAVRLGAFAMAISNIFGSNALLTAMLLLADAGYRKGPILAETTASTTFAAGLSIALTCIYLWGLLERENRRIARLGWDSAAVVVVYLAGLAVLFTLR